MGDNIVKELKRINEQKEIENRRKEKVIIGTLKHKQRKQKKAVTSRKIKVIVAIITHFGLVVYNI